MLSHMPSQQHSHPSLSSSNGGTIELDTTNTDSSASPCDVIDLTHSPSTTPEREIIDLNDSNDNYVESIPPFNFSSNANPSSFNSIEVSSPFSSFSRNSPLFIGRTSGEGINTGRETHETIDLTCGDDHSQPIFISDESSAEPLTLSSNVTHPETSGESRNEEKEGEEENEECGICYEIIRSYGIIGCGHKFCFRCITRWSKEKKVCPLCRKRFKTISSSNRQRIRRSRRPRSSRRNKYY
eukprot:gb/GECH01002579.1/.p1 GENE.gb/GECH01002579.1/~~gb/GECH01002579.1/.p1  ORF type:complete len:240 (+),score=62.09 gb/GECH01002579.1/:1-720(+)